MFGCEEPYVILLIYIVYFDVVHWIEWIMCFKSCVVRRRHNIVFVTHASKKGRVFTWRILHCLNWVIFYFLCEIALFWKVVWLSSSAIYLKRSELWWIMTCCFNELYCGIWMVHVLFETFSSLNSFQLLISIYFSL